MLSVPNPSAAEIALVCSSVRLTPKLDENGKHPSIPWDKCGRVLVRRPTIKGKKLSKQKLIRILGKRMKKWYEKTSVKMRTQEIRKFIDRVDRM